MPLLIVGGVGAVIGAIATAYVSDTVKTIVKWGAIGGAAYVGYQVLVKK